MSEEKILVCREDDIHKWAATNNPDHGPVVHHQADPSADLTEERLGGYVLRIPPTYYPQHPLQAAHESEAIEAARERLSELRKQADGQSATL